MKNRILYTFCFIIAVLLAGGCSADFQDRLQIADNPDNLLIVGGSVYEQSVPDSPIKGIKLVLSSYLKDDAVRKEAADSMVMFSNSEGLYRFQWQKFSARYVYILEAKDVDGPENKGNFKSDRIEISLFRGSPSYNEATHTYTVEGNFFYLEKK